MSEFEGGEPFDGEGIWERVEASIRDGVIGDSYLSDLRPWKIDLRKAGPKYDSILEALRNIDNPDAPL